MRKFVFPSLLLLFTLQGWCLATPEGGTSKPDLHRDIFGIRLSMTKNETDARLKEIGKFLRPDVKRQEVWEVRDPSFSHIILGFEKAGELRYVTAVAREGDGAKRITYGEIGPLQNARQAGDPTRKNFNYQWQLPAEGDEPQTLVIARGRDPEVLSTYSLKRTGEDAEKAEEDD